MKTTRCGTIVIGICVAQSTLCAGVARADLSWEHTITVRVSNRKTPPAQVKIFNQWSGQRYRLLMKYQVQGVPTKRPNFKRPTFKMPGSTLDFLPANSIAAKKPATRTAIGSFAVVQRLDDDRVVWWDSQSRQYVDEPLRALLKKTRLDIWPKTAARLSKEEPPSLTPAQRERLGAEVRAVTRPFLKRVWRAYFSPIATRRTFNGLEARGYRMTWLINAGSKKNAQWARVNSEWWLANELPGDEQARDYQRAAREFIGPLQKRTASMWLNEINPVMWEMLPQELHQAANSFLTPDKTFLAGTPVRLYMTLEPPALQRALAGDVRLEIALARRSTNPLPASIWTAPAKGYTKMPLGSQVEQMQEMMRDVLSSGAERLPGMGLPFDAAK